MRKVIGPLALSVFALLSGCSTGTVPTLTLKPQVVATGIVHGGQPPVTGATIQLWAVGTSGYGSTGTQLLTTTVTTSDGTGTSDSNANTGNANNTLPAGSFTITSDYTCPGSDPYVYITATGGNPGLMPLSTNNTAISLMAALTDCNTLKNNAASTFININEVTTVAAVYALQQFMNTSTGAIGSWSYANTGMQNAFQTVNNLASTSLGTALAVTPNGNGVVPQQEINTLADILAPCVNSSSGSSSDCASLFGDVQGSPGNTLTAALQIALHPGTNVASLYLLAGGTPPFVPTLSAAPNDWTVALAFNASASKSTGIAIDSLGNVWTANYNIGGTNSNLSKLSTLGVPQNSSPFTLSINGASALAIDTSNDVWVGNIDNSTLIGYQNGGNTYAGPVNGFTGPPAAVAFDGSNDLWITNNSGVSVAEYNPGSSSFISTGYTGGGISTPQSLAIDGSGNAWVVNLTTVSKLSSSGVASGPYSSGGLSDPTGVAIDGSGDAWIASYPSGNVIELNSSGSALSGGSGYSGGGVAPGSAIAIDGAGNVWTAGRLANTLAELTSAGAAISPSTGYQGGNLFQPSTLAIDQSGNVWVANLRTRTTNSITTTISEFVGAAAPTIQPLATAVAYGQIGQEPGTPIAVEIESGTVPYYTPGVAYSAQLYASGGNSGTFTWSQTAGTMPSGLTLSSGGLISGTTSATGSTVVSVKACDAANTSNCSSPQAFTLTANSTLTALGNESALTGSYAVEFEGYKNGSAAGLVYGIDSLASLTFNGSGAITGEIDTNNATKSSLTGSFALTGSYTYGADNRGILVITRSGGNAIEYAVVGENFSGSTPQTLRLIEFDDTGASGDAVHATGTGIAKLQTSAAFVPATLNQSFAFGLQGETPCNNDSGLNPSCPTVSPYGPLSAVGQFTGDNAGNITSGEEDAAAINTTYNAVTLSGAYTSPDSSGRGQLTLTPTGTIYPAAPTTFAYYIVNSGEMFLMSINGHASASMLAGDALVQSGSLSASTLTGNYVAYEQAPNNGDGVASFPTQLDSSLIYLAVQSGSQITATIDENNGSGNVKLEQTQGPFSYTVAANGRMSIGSGLPLFYVASSGAFFGTEQPSGTNQGGPGLFTAQQQTAGTFTCGPTSGTYAIGEPPVPLAADTLSGYFLAGTGAFTIDLSGNSPDILEQGLAGTSSCTSDSLTSTTGRFVLTTNVTLFNSTQTNAAYTIVPNSKYVEMSIDPTSGKPDIITVEK